MFPPFDTELALHYGRVLAKKIDSGECKLIPKTKPSMERLNQGVMLGVLVCSDENGNRKILACPSGIHWELTYAKPENGCDDGQNQLFLFVPPVVSPLEIENALLQNDEEIHLLTDKIKSGEGDLAELKKRRTSLTTESLNRVHALYKFHTINGNVFALSELIATRKELPPTGIGDCCEIKLLDYAFSNKMHPVSMAQVYYEKAMKNLPGFVPPCDSRCSWLLPSMLGLNVLYQDDHICVINKPSGLLSVPGRTQENQDSAETRLSVLYPGVIKQSAVHRLDMETSGILVLAKTEQAHRNLRLQFENKTVEKRYSALLSGILEKSDGAISPKKGEKSGTATLPFRLDVENRPHQIYDPVDGNPGTTEWHNMGVEVYTRPDGTKIKATRMHYIPKTGRTHQLRLLSADPHGFNLPIIGDSLYGQKMEGETLQLTSVYIKLRHPVSGVEMEWELPER